MAVSVVSSRDVVAIGCVGAWSWSWMAPSIGLVQMSVMAVGWAP